MPSTPWDSFGPLSYLEMACHYLCLPFGPSLTPSRPAVVMPNLLSSKSDAGSLPWPSPRSSEPWALLGFLTRSDEVFASYQIQWGKELRQWLLSTKYKMQTDTCLEHERRRNSSREPFLCARRGANPSFAAFQPYHCLRNGILIGRCRFWGSARKITCSRSHSSSTTDLRGECRPSNFRAWMQRLLGRSLTSASEAQMPAPGKESQKNVNPCRGHYSG